MSFTNFFYHIVFATKNRLPVITHDVERRVYGLLYSLMKDMGAHVYRIGGMPEHVHIFASIPSTIAIGEFVKELKRKASALIKAENIVNNWGGWQEGYGGFSYSRHDKDTVIEYIKNQKEHHKVKSFIEEYREWLIENGVSPDAPYFPK